MLSQKLQDFIDKIEKNGNQFTHDDVSELMAFFPSNVPEDNEFVLKNLNALTCSFPEVIYNFMCNNTNTLLSPDYFNENTLDFILNAIQVFSLCAITNENKKFRDKYDYMLHYLGENLADKIVVFPANYFAKTLETCHEILKTPLLSKAFTTSFLGIINHRRPDLTTSTLTSNINSNTAVVSKLKTRSYQLIDFSSCPPLSTNQNTAPNKYPKMRKTQIT